MKVKLFQPENETQKLPTEGWILPDGLAYIGTYARQHGHDVHIFSAIDGATLEEMVLEAADADVIGITTTASTYHTALCIAREAKRKNPHVLVVFGGPQVSARAEEAILNRGPGSKDHCIDIICNGDGVMAFNDILDGKPLEKIANLVYLHDGSVVKAPKAREDISLWPSIDYSFFNMEKITLIYGEKFKEITPFKKGLGVMSSFGCAAQHQCGFCARIDRKLRHKPVEKFWEEVFFATKNFGVEYFFDLADSILDSPEHLNQLIDTKPREINPRFRVFARADQLANSENLDLLEKFGVYETFVGFESGSRQILQAMYKDTTPEQNLKAARALGERGIFIVGCFVLGAPGETTKTLEESVRHAEEIQRISNNHLLVCGASPVNVLPGSPWFALIKNTAVILGNDDLDRNFLRDVWYSKFCPTLTPELVEQYAEKIRIASGAKMQYEKGTDKKI